MMSYRRLVELFSLLVHNSAIAARGLTVELGDNVLNITDAGSHVGAWSHDGENFVLVRGCCPDVNKVVETVTEAVHVTMCSLSDCRA